jgi:hypothetical protein
MKKLETLGRKLSKEEQKKITGGLEYVQYLKGTRFDNGQCYCDICNLACPNNICCDQPCASFLCSGVTFDPNPCPTWP